MMMARMRHKTVSATFSVRFDQLQQLDELAERRDKSRSTILQEALDAFLARLAPTEVPKVVPGPQRPS